MSTKISAVARVLAKRRIHSSITFSADNWHAHAAAVPPVQRRGFSVQTARAAPSTTRVGNVELSEVLPKPHQRHLPRFDNLAELMEGAGDKYATRDALGVKTDGKYTFLKYSEVKAQVGEVRTMLKQLGVVKGDRVALISRNRLEWVTTAYAAYGLGAVVVPMYEQQKPADWKYIVEDSQAKILIVSTTEIFEKTKAFTEFGVSKVLCCDLEAGHPNAFATAQAAGAAAAQSPVDPSVCADDLADLIYTSGTTGQPKGVMLTHGNLVSNVKNIVDHSVDGALMVTPNDRSLAFLPWAHSYGQTCELHAGVGIGASSGIAAGAPGDSAELLRNLKEVAPTVIFSVPTLFKRVYDGVHKKIADEPSRLKRFLMRRALDVGREVNAVKLAGKSPGPWLAWQHSFLDAKVLSKMREPFGGNLRMAVAAGAPTPIEVLEFMENLGISVTEGYGLTETSPVLSITYPSPKHRILGTVGRAVPGTEVRLVLDGADVAAGEEGELWVSGPQVMKGYWRKPEATAEAFAEEQGKRWFKTGDLARLLDLPGLPGHIKITGRIKDQYKLENGKYVAPSPIEGAISLNKLVLQAVLYGSGKPHNVAVVVPDMAAVAQELGREDWFDPAKLCKEPAVAELLLREVAAECTKRGVKKYEQPKALLIVHEPFTVDNEMLTPKLSIRKPNVVKKYKAELDALYK